MISVVAIVSALVLLPVTASAAPDDPPAPTLTSVTAKLDTLAHKTEVLAERYNKARIEVTAAERTARSARRDAEAAAARFEAARGELRAIVAAQYQGGSFSSTGALLASQSSESYLDTLATLELVATHRSGVVARLAHAERGASAAQKKAGTALREARAKRNAVAAQRSKAAKETKKYQTLLSRLTAAQRAAYVTREAATPAQAASVKAVHAGSPAAQRAVDFALAQVGKPYVFGAAGPEAYDCSGLTMSAWAAGGVSLPHLAASQYNYGTQVSASQLRPGDLVFLYQPIGHVSIYIGNGMLVSAPQPGENVQVVPFARFAADVTGATRLT